MSTSEDLVILGDCRDVLKGFQSESFDSMVTDPPAGISFMNTKWDRHTLDGFEYMLTKVFLEAYRVLKPGAHVLVWSIPRTSHRTACAIESAGFIIRDGLDNVKDRSVEVQAFLESLTEEQVELLVRAGPADSFILHMFGQGFPKGINIQKALAKAGSSEASKWEGFGTALKPGVETWWLARKPLQEKTVTEQVLATGTGALNIDGCRAVPTGESYNRAPAVSGFSGIDGYKGEGRCPDPSGPGRWPANVILQHGPDCRLVGKKNAPASSGVSKNKPITSKRSGNGPLIKTGGYLGEGFIQPVHGYANDDGTETIDNWECAPGCPVQALDGDGGASRFFNNFEPDPEALPFFYTSKISPSERKEDFDEEGLVNKHPTVKSKKLMRHLVRLVTPPGGRVLDPFCGSGTTIVAAIEEGMDGVGIEKDSESHTIALKRVISTLERVQAHRDQDETFDYMFRIESE